jgi:hypothetical protein
MKNKTGGYLGGEDGKTVHKVRAEIFPATTPWEVEFSGPMPTNRQGGASADRSARPGGAEKSMLSIFASSDEGIGQSMPDMNE